MLHIYSNKNVKYIFEEECYIYNQRRMLHIYSKRQHNEETPKNKIATQ